MYSYCTIHLYVKSKLCDNYLKSTASNCIHNRSIMDHLILNAHLVSSQYQVCVGSGPLKKKKKNFFLLSPAWHKENILSPQEKSNLMAYDSTSLQKALMIWVF